MPNSSIDDMLRKQPLISFSIYTAAHVQTLYLLGERINALIDQMKKPEVSYEGVDAGPMSEAYGLFWLWVLGAYEVVRTMVSPKHKHKLSEELRIRLEQLKVALAKVRIPFAKLELRGNAKPAGNALSIKSFGANLDDLIFEIENKRVSARTLITEFDLIFRAIVAGDFRADSRTLG